MRANLNLIRCFIVQTKSDRYSRRMSVVISTFPGQNSIPPATFYNMNGLATWLNHNPSYKNYFINYPRQFPGLSTVTSTLSSIRYNPANVPLAPQVITLSQNESQLYKEQIELFQRVYAYNSNAYINARAVSGAPMYYSFNSYQELMKYRSSVSLVNKLYPFNAMMNGTDQTGRTLGWFVPFPL